MRRLLAAAVIAGAVVAPATAAHATHYWRTCGGVVDYECEGRVCPTDCWTRECLIWIDPLHDDTLAQCVTVIGHS